MADEINHVDDVAISESVAADQHNSRTATRCFGYAICYMSDAAPRNGWVSGVKVDGVDDLNHLLWHFMFHQAPDVPEALVSGRERMYLAWFYQTFAYDKGAIGEEEIAEYVRCYSAPGGLRAGFAHYRAFPEDARQVAEWAKSKLRMPVLALGGESLLGEITKKLYGAVATDVRGGVIPQCGHWVADERPDYLVDQLLAFFAP